MKRNLALFLFIFLLAQVLTFPMPGNVFAAGTAQDLLNDTVSYYVNHHTSLEHWEEVIGLANAGEDVSESPWTIPDWDVGSLGPGSSVGEYAGTILGMLGAGQDPSNIGGRNLVQELADRQADTGKFSSALNYTIWAIIALDTAEGNYNDSNALNYLISQQKGDGGFALSGSTGDPDMTGMALMALSSHTDKPGVNESIDSAKNFLKDIQLATAGFGNPESTESIACVIRGLTACGDDVTAGEWQKSGLTMVDALLDFRLADYSFSHLKGAGSNLMATRQALIALGDLVNGNVFFNLKNNEPDPGGGGQVSVKVRVEGATESKAEATVTVSGTALDALKAAIGEGNVVAPGGFITSILGESGQVGAAPGTDTYWMYYVIREGEIEPTAFSSGAGDYNVADGDEVIFYIGASDATTFEARTYFPVVTVSPADPKAGQTVTLTLGAKKYVWGSGLTELSAGETATIGDYTVTVDGTPYTSQFGQVSLPGVTEGEYDYTVSNANDAGYPDVVTFKGEITVGPAGGGSIVPDEVYVNIAVVGQDGELLFGPGSVAVSEDGEWGCTAMGALHATGLDYTMSSEFDGYVDAVGGQAKIGLNGWMYKVNNVTPMVLAKDKTVEEGDKIIWWYSTDMDDPGPAWNSLITGAPTVAPVTTTQENSPQISKEAQEVLDKITELLGLNQGTTDMGTVGEAVIAVIVVNGTELPSRSEFVDQKNTLSGNIVGLNQSVDAAKGALISDPLGEVNLGIPAGALEANTSISVTETAVFTGSGSLEGGAATAPADYRQLSSVYQFGPDGTIFAEPVTLALKVAIPPLVAPENITLAWYDKENGRWVAIPAVVDVSNGLIMAKISHFTDFAVLARQVKKSFKDVTLLSYGWAQEPIELLAGAKVINGIDGSRFEPERAITRAELAGILVKAMNLPAVAGGAAFKDVTGSDWYSGCVAAAAQAGLFSGYEDGTFRPDRTITREEMVAVLARALDLATPSGATLHFTDEGRISSWARDSVAAAVSDGLTKGYSDGTFQPQSNATRAECAVMVYHALVEQ